jgi:hypothetical protein
MKKRVMTNATVIADLDKAVHASRSIEEYAKQLERAVKEFHDFIRDHRSMDWVSLHVEREYEDRCTHCDYLWEVDSEGVPVCCHKAIDEHESQLNSEARESHVR